MADTKLTSVHDTISFSGDESTTTGTSTFGTTTGYTESSWTTGTETTATGFSRTSQGSYSTMPGDSTTETGFTNTTLKGTRDGDNTVHTQEDSTAHTQTVTDATQALALISGLVHINPHLKDSRIVLMMRGGERMDRTFPEWTRVNFSDHGRYMPFNLNQPLRLPRRPKGHSAFHNDSPITELGQITAQMLGRSLAMHELTPVRIFASPALRCIQTAAAMQKMLNNPRLEINVEPGLFEWRNWYETMPRLLTAEEVANLGITVNKSYTPIITAAALTQLQKEDPAQLYFRHQKTIQYVLKNHCPSKGPILIVGHGVTMDAGARGLLRKEHGKEEEMDQFGIHYPHCGLVALEEDKGTADTWKLIRTPIPPFHFINFSNKVDTRFLLR